MIRARAGFDLLVTGPLALPPTARTFVEALGRADALARCGVAALIAGYVAGGSVPRVLLAFAATELLGAVAQARARRARP